MAQKIMTIDSTIRVKMNTAGDSGGFITAKKDMQSGFNDIAKEIELIETEVANISNIWEGKASKAFVKNMTTYINKLKKYCNKSDGTMYNLYKTGMVKAKSQYTSAENRAIEKINSVKF